MAEKRLEITNQLSFNSLSSDHLFFHHQSDEITRNKNSTENLTNTVKEECSTLHEKYSAMKENNPEEMDEDRRKIVVMKILPENCGLEITNENGERMEKIPVNDIKKEKDIVSLKDTDYSPIDVLPENKIEEFSERNKYPTSDSINQKCSTLYGNYSAKRTVKNGNSEDIDENSRKNAVMRTFSENFNISYNCGLEGADQNGKSMQQIPMIYVKKNKELVSCKDADYSRRNFPENKTNEFSEGNKCIDTVFDSTSIFYYNYDCNSLESKFAPLKTFSEIDEDDKNISSAKFSYSPKITVNIGMLESRSVTDDNPVYEKDTKIRIYSANSYNIDKNKKVNDRMREIQITIIAEDNYENKTLDTCVSLDEKKDTLNTEHRIFDDDNRNILKYERNGLKHTAVSAQKELDAKCNLSSEDSGTNIPTKNESKFMMIKENDDFLYSTNPPFSYSLKNGIINEESTKSEGMFPTNKRTAPAIDSEYHSIGKSANKKKIDQNRLQVFREDDENSFPLYIKNSHKNNQMEEKKKSEIAEVKTFKNKAIDECISCVDYGDAVVIDIIKKDSEMNTIDKEVQKDEKFDNRIYCKSTCLGVNNVKYSEMESHENFIIKDSNSGHSSDITDNTAKYENEITKIENEEGKRNIACKEDGHFLNVADKATKTYGSEIPKINNREIEHNIECKEDGCSSDVIDKSAKTSESEVPKIKNREAKRSIECKENRNSSNTAKTYKMEIPTIENRETERDNKLSITENKKAKHSIASKEDGHSSSITDENAKTYGNGISEIKRKEAERNIEYEEDGPSSDVIDKTAKMYGSEIPTLEKKEAEGNIGCKEDDKEYKTYLSGIPKIENIEDECDKEFPNIENKQHNIAFKKDHHSLHVTDKSAKSHGNGISKTKNREVERNIKCKEDEHSSNVTFKAAKTYEIEITTLENKEEERNIECKEDRHSSDVTDKDAKTYRIEIPKIENKRKEPVNKPPNIKNKEAERNIVCKEDDHASDVTDKAAEAYEKEITKIDKDAKRNIASKDDNGAIIIPPSLTDFKDVEKARYMQEPTQKDVIGKANGYVKENEVRIYDDISEGNKNVWNLNDKAELKETGFYTSCQEILGSYISIFMGFGVRTYVKYVYGTENEMSNDETEPTEDCGGLASSNFCHSSSVKHEMSNPNCLQNHGHERETVSSGKYETRSDEIKTLEDALNYFNLSCILEQLEKSLEDVRRRRKTKEEHESFLKDIDKQIQKLSFKFHPDRIRNKGGSEEEIKTAEKLQGAINSIRTALNALNEAFFEDLGTDHRYGFYTKLDLTSLANENAVKSHVYEVIFQIGLLSETKRRKVIAETQKFLINSQNCVQSYFNCNMRDFEKHRDSALFHLSRCIEGYTKLHNELSVIQNECRVEKLDNMSLTINKMCSENERALKVLSALEKIAKKCLAGSLQIFTTSDALDEYYVLPFVYYVNVLLLCNVMVKSRTTKFINDAWKPSFIDNEIFKFGGLSFYRPYLLVSSFISNEECKDFCTDNMSKEEIKEEFHVHLKIFDDYLKNTFKASNYVDDSMKSNLSEEIKKCMKMMFEFQTKEKELSGNIEEIKKKTELMDEKYEKIMAKNRELNKITQEQVEKNKKLSHRTSLVLSEKVYME